MNGKAKEYALAIFGLAKEQNLETMIKESLRNIQLGLNEEQRVFFRHPKISKQTKKDVLQSVVKEELLLHFLYLLIDNQRFDWFDEIILEYNKLMDQLNRILKVVVYSKTGLSTSVLESIKQKFEADHHRVVVMESVIDSTLLGGIRLEYDGFVEDRTINRYLGDLTQSLRN
jgi:F-type H+-transporting ATPase subunit delta